MTSSQSLTVEFDPEYYPRAGKQKAFHDDRYDFWARLISAGTGGGKTKAGLFEAYLWALEVAESVGYIFAPSFPRIRRILLPAMGEMFGKPLESCPAILNFNRTDMRIDFINGSEWWLVGLEDPESAEGVNIDYAWCDEWRLVGGSGPSAKGKQETAWQSIIRRLRGSGRTEIPCTGLWVTTTPGAPGSRLHQAFEGADPDKRLKRSHKVYRWSIDSNPFLSQGYIQEVKASHIPGTGLYNRFVLGLFAAVAGGTYAFDPSIHVIEETPGLGYFQYVVYAVDWGWSNPACIYAYGVDYDNRLYVLDEFYQRRTPRETLIQVAVEMRDRWGEGVFVCGAEEPEGIEDFNNAGLAAVKNEWKRDDGIREMGSRFQVAGDGKPRIFVHRSCVNWIEEVQVYDELKKEFDHAMDNTRYALSHVEPYIGKSWILY